MTKLSFFSCALVVGSFAAGCGGSDDGGDGPSSSTTSGSGGSSSSGTSSGSNTMTSATSGGGASATSASTSSATSASTSSATSASTSSATSGNTNSSTSGSTSVPGNTPLTDIDTDAEAEAVCEQLASEFGAIDVDSVTSGVCALAGLIGELIGGGTCEMLQAECIADDEDDPMNMTEGCTADDVPDCDITVDEYTACTSARVQASFDAFAEVTCDSDFETIGEEPADPPACAGLAERCPELAAE